MGEDRATKCSCRCDDQYERIVWLTHHGKRIDPFKEFQTLRPVEKKCLWMAFRYWSLGIPHDSRHHGWPNKPEYKECHVFKDNPHRLYGFVFRSKQGKEHDLCVICEYAKKTGKKTDYAILDRINGYRVDNTILKAVADLK